MGQSSCSHGSLSLIQVSEYFADHRRVFDAGDDTHITAAFTAGCDIDIKYPLQPSPHGAYFWCAQVIDAWRSAGVWSGCCLAVLPLIPLPRLAGVTIVRYLLLGANTPWKRVRWTLGLGTKATSLETVAPAHPCARDIPFVLNIKSSGTI